MKKRILRASGIILAIMLLGVMAASCGPSQPSAPSAPAGGDTSPAPAWRHGSILWPQSTQRSQRSCGRRYLARPRISGI